MAERLAVLYLHLWKPEEGELIPPEWYWRVVDSLGYLYLWLLRTRDMLELIAPATEVRAIEKTVGTTAEPLYTDELRCHRIIVQNPPDSLYCIYLGDAYVQALILRPSERITLQVRDPRKVYVRSNGQVKVKILFEVTK